MRLNTDYIRTIYNLQYLGARTDWEGWAQSLPVVLVDTIQNMVLYRKNFSSKIRKVIKTNYNQLQFFNNLFGMP